MPGYRSEFMSPYMPPIEKREPGEKPAPNYGSWWEKRKQRGVYARAAAAAGRNRAKRLDLNLQFSGGKRTRKNKSKKRSKSRKN